MERGSPGPGYRNHCIKCAVLVLLAWSYTVGVFSLYLLICTFVSIACCSLLRSRWMKICHMLLSCVSTWLLSCLFAMCFMHMAFCLFVCQELFCQSLALAPPFVVFFFKIIERLYIRVLPGLRFSRQLCYVENAFVGKITGLRVTLKCLQTICIN